VKSINRFRGLRGYSITAFITFLPDEPFIPIFYRENQMSNGCVNQSVNGQPALSKRINFSKSVFGISG
jgi:hypothetical protein